MHSAHYYFKHYLDVLINYNYTYKYDIPLIFLQWFSSRFNCTEERKIMAMLMGPGVDTNVPVSLTNDKEGRKHELKCITHAFCFWSSVLREP
jgi:hypothetical protein